MDRDQICLLNLSVALLLLLLRRRLITVNQQLRRPKRFGVHPILQGRKEQGFYDNLLREARLSDPYLFYNFTRMTPSSFDKLLGIVGPYLKKTSRREPILPGCR